jgi:hypothetical protein
MANKIDGTPHLPHTPNKIKWGYEVDPTPPPMTKMQQIKSWTPWGKETYGYMDEKENIDTWFCQACSKEQPKEMDCHRLEISPSISLRICGVCKHIMTTGKLTYQQLIRRVRG